MSALHRVVIIGGGFGGLNAALALRKAPVQVTLIDRRNFHLFQPLLYQVASGALSPANIASPLRGILREQANARVLLGDVVNIDAHAQQVVFADGTQQSHSVPYDSLVVAAGASHSYFGNDHWQPLAPGLKTIEDATQIRHRLLAAFEAAEHAAWRGAPTSEIHRLLTFVIVGAGPTGVELAGALGEITRDTLRGNFRHINPADASIYLIENAPRVLPPYAPSLAAQAERSLRELGVQVRTSTLVAQVHADHVVLRSDAGTEVIAVGNVIWAAGVKASPLGEVLREATGVSLDRAGRVEVQADLTLQHHPEIFVVGDLAHFKPSFEKPPLPGVAPVAMQQGQYVGRVISRRLHQPSAKKTRPFHYVDYGSMATIGRGRAVVDIHGLRLAGFSAWILWLFVHLLALVGFHNKLLVMLEWSWCYLTRNRSARLITAGAAAPSLNRSLPEQSGQPEVLPARML